MEGARGKRPSMNATKEVHGKKSGGSLCYRASGTSAGMRGTHQNGRPFLHCPGDGKRDGARLQHQQELGHDLAWDGNEMRM